MLMEVADLWLMGYPSMDPSKRLTTDELVALIPEWCHEGNLVYVDYYEDVFEENTIGLILDYYVIDVDHLNQEEYDELVYHEEWLLLDISTDSGVIEAINSYNVSPVTLKIKVEESNAKIQRQ